MRISASVANAVHHHRVTVSTDGRDRALGIPPKSTGMGSSVNGGELFFLALATCFCNDLYREADKRGITVRGVTVEVTGTFGVRGEPARGVTYSAEVDADAPAAVVADLVGATDKIAEIQRTVREGCAVTLVAKR